MKKFWLLIAGGVAGLILLANLGPMVGFAVSLVVLYFIFKEFLKTESIWVKVALAFVGVMIITATATNIPAIIGVAAAYVLYLVFQKWNEFDFNKPKKEKDDPFQNFEKQWAELKKDKL